MPARFRRSASRWGAVARGFTLVEMLIVAALIGLLAGIALPNYRNAQRKARESVLRENLWILRDLIDQHKSDKGIYPDSLEDLVSKGYVRRVPVDPITDSAETWIEVREEVVEDAPEEEEADTGIQDVQSGAVGQTLDGVPYSEL